MKNLFTTLFFCCLSVATLFAQEEIDYSVDIKYSENLGAYLDLLVDKNGIIIDTLRAHKYPVKLIGYKVADNGSTVCLLTQIGYGETVVYYRMSKSDSGNWLDELKLPWHVDPRSQQKFKIAGVDLVKSIDSKGKEINVDLVTMKKAQDEFTSKFEEKE